MRLFLGDQSVVITKDFSLYFEEADMCVHVVSSSGANLLFEVRPRRACGACGVYGLGSPRVVGVAAPSDPVRSIIVEILRVSKAGM